MNSAHKYVLMLSIDDDHTDLVDMYDSAIKKREGAICEDPDHIDSGFDLFMPKNLNFQAWETQIVDLGISCAAYKICPMTRDERRGRDAFADFGVPHHLRGMKLVPSPFYIYPRSSISKTPFRLANGTGIVDSGYRGNLKGAFDCAKPTAGVINKYSRLLQICMPDLSPFEIQLVGELDKTRRGAGGFGSTGS